ncbi:CD244 molecule, natural killer cell receptor 2B4, transcript variant X3 [Columba livia]|uniref:CD244 molecule, natural killer cell receptor 2B4, transcript variant X3 n=1 Tax=Columba livia TaxID=8932 RepID=A0A2I0MB71_COLLI|nr:CD244 molecule, natural killer cell receptor 2B4, transcript variant X3 [Columba livia]
MIPEAKGKHNSLINTSVFTSSIFLPVHCPSQAHPSCPERPSQEHVAAGAHPSCWFESLQGFTMLTWLQATITGYLLLVLEGSFAVKELTERRVAAEGSSVLMDAPDIKNVKLTEWEYIRNTTSELILQYYANSQSPTIYPAYQKPVPQPELQCRSNLAGLPIELVCMVPEGMVASITWKKEGQPLPPEKFSLLSGNTTVLQIRSGEKSDCGSYSCNVSNVISWKEAVLNLTVTGLTPNLHHVQRLAIVALMLVTFSAISFIFVLCQLMELRSGKEAWKHIILFTYGLLCISSLLLFATSIIWMQEEGLSVTFILLGMFFFTAVIGTAQAAAAVVWKPAALSRFKMKMWHCVIRNSIAPTTLIVNLLFTTLSLHNIQQLHERGCSEAVDLMTSCVFAAAAVVTALLLLFLCYHGKKRKEQMMRSHHTNRSTRVRATMQVMEEIHGQRR